jgi:hypothetical protein
MFFSNIDEFKEHADVATASFDFNSVIAKLNNVDRDILKHYFSNDFIDELQTAYDDAGQNLSSLTTSQELIIKKLRSVSAPIAFALYISSGQVQIDNSGIFIFRNENRATAFEWQIDELIKSYLKPGYQAIEDTILFLQKHITDYTTYKDSEEFEYYKLPFISTSKEFTKVYSNLNNSFMSYIKLRSCMDKAEEEIENILLPDYFTALKNNLKNDTLSTADKSILPNIKKAIGNLTIARAMSELNVSFDKQGFLVFDNTQGVKPGISGKTAVAEPLIRAQKSLQESGNSYLKKVKDFLEANLSSFPVYRDDTTRVAGQSSSIQNDSTQQYFIGM